MEGLTKFLETRRVRTTGGAHNLVSLCGGKWNVLPSERGEFFDAYKRAAEGFTVDHHCSFIYRTPEGPQPLYLDVDIKTATKIQLHTDKHHELACRVASLLDSEGPVEYLVVQKESGYWKKTNVYATGSHLYFPGSCVDNLRAEEIRLAALQFIPEIFGDIDLLNKPDDILDRSVASRRNGLLMLFDYKGPGKGGQYNVKIKGEFDCETGADFEEYVGSDFIVEADMEKIYGFAFKTPRVNKQPTPPAPKKKPPPPPKKPSGNNDNVTSFDLERYLAALSGWRPDNSDYVKLCMYFASTGLDTGYISDCCNKAWLQPGDDPHETRRILVKYRGNTSVGRGTAQLILRQYATGRWVADDIFPRKRYRYYNEYTQFLYKINDERDIECFLKDVVGFIFSAKKFAWEYFVEREDNHGQHLQDVSTELSKNPPFFKTDDLCVTVYPTKKILVAALKKRVTKKTKDPEEIELYSKVNRLIKSSGKDSVDLFFSKCRIVLEDDCPEPTSKKMSSILNRLHSQHLLKRYAGLCFRPYAGPRQQGSRQMLNTFTGFHFERYVPGIKVDVRSTFTWKYLVDVYGWGEEGPLFQYVLRLIAWFVQFPHLRTERIMAIISTAEGTGKSTFFHLLACVLGNRYCIFHDSLKPYLQQFNIINHSKLVIWADDISASSAQHISRKLFSKCTSKTQVYESKGETQFTLDEFSNLFITSNQKTPLHCSPTDRRQLLFEVSESHVQDREFFAKVHSEFANHDVGFALYQFFKTLDLGNFHPSQNPPSDTKRETIEACMKKSHAFMNRFYCNLDWVTTHVPWGDSHAMWARKIEATVKQRGDYAGQLMIRVEQKTFYTQYAKFMKENYPSSKPRNINTFLQEVAELGVLVHDKRKPVNKRNYHVVDIYYKRFAGMWKKLYKTEANSWDSEIDRGVFLDELKRKQYWNDDLTVK